MRLICVLAVFSALACPLLALDREAFTFTRYDLELRIEPEQQRLGVRGRLTVRNDSQSTQANLVMQISSTLNWLSIRVEGKPVTFLTQTYTSDLDHTGALTEAIVTLPRALRPQESAELEIGYEGVVPQDATRLTRIGTPLETARHSDWDQIGRNLTVLRGAGYVAWYPIATEAASLSQDESVFEAVDRWKQREADAEMKIHVAFSEAGAQFVCTGETVTEEAGQTTCRFSSLATSLPVFAIGDYQTLDRGGVTIWYRNDRKSAAENYGLALDQTAPLVEKWFGNHREQKGANAQVLDLPDEDAAFESGSTLLMPLAADDTKLLLSAVRLQTRIVFSSPRSWISQGLAAYAEAALINDRKGRDAAIAYLELHRGALIDTEKTPGGAARSLINARDQFYVEAKAMNLWWALRELVGEQALSSALHRYRISEDKDAYSMQKLIEAEAHRDLSWFFDDWVYRDKGLPDFRISSVYVRPLVNGGSMATVTVENLGGAAAEVPVKVKMVTGEATERLLVPGNAKASVRILAATTLLEVSVNDGSVPESDETNNVYKMKTD